MFESNVSALPIGPWKIRPIASTETSVPNHLTLRNNPEDGIILCISYFVDLHPRFYRVFLNSFFSSTFLHFFLPFLVPPLFFPFLQNLVLPFMLVTSSVVYSRLALLYTHPRLSSFRINPPPLSLLPSDNTNTNNDRTF